MSRFLRLPVFTLFALLSLPVGAVEVSGLYQADVDVPDQSESARHDGFKEALRAVLAKVSGIEPSSRNDHLRDALERPSRYVSQFSYRTEDRTLPPPEPMPAEDGSVAAVTLPAPLPLRQLVLTARFEPQAIDKLLGRAGLPIWGSARPMTLLWLAVDVGGERLLVGANDEGLAREIFERGARARALPITLPLLDLRDQQALTAADVFGGFREAIISASSRYAPQSILAGRLYQDGEKWHGEWNLFYGESVSSWEQTSSEPEEVLLAATRSTAEALARSTAHALAEGGGQLTMTVAGIGDMVTFNRVNSYLTTLSGVNRVQVTRMSGNQVEFAVEAAGDAAALARTIALGNTLTPQRQAVPAPENATTNEETESRLNYRVLGK